MYKVNSKVRQFAVQSLNPEYKTIDIQTTTKTSFLKQYSATISIILLAILFVGIEISASTFLLMRKLDNLELKLLDLINNKTAESDWELHKNGTNNLLGNLQQNKIMSRTDWGAADSTKPLDRLKWPINTVYISHTNTRSCNDFKSCRLQINMIQLFYIDVMNFKDIGYNFLISGDGVVYEGIGWQFIGNHTYGHNQNSIGIGFIGNYQNETPTNEQLNATINLLSIGVTNNYLDKNYVVKGQKDLLPIVSSGKNLYGRIMDWAHYYKQSNRTDNQT